MLYNCAAGMIRGTIGEQHTGPKDGCDDEKSEGFYEMRPKGAQEESEGFFELSIVIRHETREEPYGSSTRTGLLKKVKGKAVPVPESACLVLPEGSIRDQYLKPCPVPGYAGLPYGKPRNTQDLPGKKQAKSRVLAKFPQKYFFFILVRHAGPVILTDHHTTGT
jgi:hypothetical protein